MGGEMERVSRERDPLLIPEHALGLLLSATEGLLGQEISVVEWAVQWECCARDLDSGEWPEAHRARQCLEILKKFASMGSLPQLDRGLAQLRDLAGQWNHWWWVAQRSGNGWPPPRRGDKILQVTRQAGRSRVSWQCPQCPWSLSWDVETAAWQILDWPGAIQCPLCSTTSSGAPPDDENPPSECER